MKKIPLLLLLMFTIPTIAQDPYLQKSSDVLEAEAKKITDAYNMELVMTTQQQILFKNKVEEFLIRAEEINAQLSGREKLDNLYNLQINETAEMGDILTQPQYRLYKKLKPKIQPLATVEE